MGRVRRAYYDIFLEFYDRSIALHSHDNRGLVRKFQVDRVSVQKGHAVLDLCTGTGTLLTYLREKIGYGGQVVGVDFSRGMLKAAQQTSGAFKMPP